MSETNRPRVARLSGLDVAPSETRTAPRSGVQKQLDFLGLFSGVVTLALTIANNTQSFISLVDFSERIVRNWTLVTNGVREWFWQIASSLFSVQLHWVTARLVPTLLVLTAIVGFGLRRRRAGAAPFGLGLAQQTPALSTAVALFLILAMVVLEQSYFSLGEDGKTPMPPGMTTAQQEEMVAYLKRCRADWGFTEESPLDAVCAITSADSPVLQARLQFQVLDWLIVVSYLALLVFVVMFFQAEVMWAFLLAVFFAGLGHVVAWVRDFL